MLLLPAEDDPIIPRRVYEVACEDALATDHVAVCLTACGGHVAHFEGLAAPRPWWLKPAGGFLGNAVAAARRKAGGPAAAAAGKRRASVERAGPTAGPGPPKAEPSFAFAAPPPGAAPPRRPPGAPLPTEVLRDFKSWGQSFLGKTQLAHLRFALRANHHQQQVLPLLSSSLWLLHLLWLTVLNIHQQQQL